MKALLRPALSLFLALTAITGVLYPLAVRGLGTLLFPEQVRGAIVMRGDVAVGSDLIGQNFADPRNFWGRLSATAPQPNNGLASGGSNLGPENPALLEAVNARLDALRQADPDNRAPVPVDLVTASGSGLDPDITPAAAQYQLARVARLRGVAEARVAELIAQATTGRQLGVLGEPRVNVLRLNLALESLR